MIELAEKKDGQHRGKYRWELERLPVEGDFTEIDQHHDEKEQHKNGAGINKHEYGGDQVEASVLYLQRAEIECGDPAASAESAR